MFIECGYAQKYGNKDVLYDADGIENIEMTSLHNKRLGQEIKSRKYNKYNESLYNHLK